jgi:proteasome lid subunit RPN8/RPN11
VSREPLLSHAQAGDEELAAFAAEPPSGTAVAAPDDLAVEAGAPILAEGEARIPAPLLQELIDWARQGLPDEACGIVVGDRPFREAGRPLRFEPLTNAAHSPTRYLIDPVEQLRVMTAIDDAGEEPWAIFHSHVASVAEPSRTDVALAFYPESLYLICSLADDTRPVVRAWTITDGSAVEVTLSITEPDSGRAGSEP